MSKNKLLYTLILAGLSSVPAIAMAEAPADPAKASAAPAAPAAPTLSSILDASGITATGYVDVGYTSLNSTGAFVGGVPSRVFDAPNPTAGKNFSSFNLNQAAITVSKAPKEGFGGVVTLTAGQDANVISSYGAGNTGAANPYTFNHNLDVTQAYASYASGPLTVIAGKLLCLAGAEVIAGPSNTNLSRSILFGYAMPYTHTGVRATYAATDTVSLIGGVNNGWDQVSDSNTDKTIELSLTAAPSKMFSLAATYLGGKELSGGFTAPQATNGNRQLIDLVGTINATDSLSIVLNYDNGTQDNAGLANGTTGKGTWSGLAAYVNYQFSDKLRASLRSEYLDDKNGVRLPIAAGATTGQKWSETSLTLAYIPVPSFELRGEVRGDSSNQKVFLSSDNTAKSNQTSFGLEAIYKF
jgi:hypothetical protein